MFFQNSIKWLQLLIKKYGERYIGTYATSPFTCHLLEAENQPKTSVTIIKEEAIKLYTDMTMIRTMEKILCNLYRSKVVRGFCHLYNGQEAIAAGIYDRMRPIDNLISSYRVHGFGYLMSGRNAECVMAELAGVESGCAKGKGGSMHIYAKNLYGGNGIVGAQVPLGTGLAFAHKYSNTKGVTFTLYGDGAANQGQVFESYNIAKLWNLPVIFVVENNLYGMGTHVSRSSANTNYYAHCTYIPGILVDGMDVLSVTSATQFAMDHISKGLGPIILEMRAYRYVGHSMSDPGSSYRNKEEIDKIRNSRDPIKTFGLKIMNDKLVAKETLDKIKADAKKKIYDIVEKIKGSKELNISHLTADITKRNLEKKIRNVSVFRPLVHMNYEPPK